MTSVERHWLAVVATLIAGLLTSCSSVPTAKQLDAAKSKIDAAKAAAEDVAARAAQAKEKALKVSHEALDAIALARAGAVALGVLTPELTDWSQVAIVRARATLDRVERGEQVTREELESVLGDVRTVVTELRKVGAKVDPVVDSALELVGLVVGAA